MLGLILLNQMANTLAFGVGACWDWFKARASIELVMWLVVLGVCNFVLWTDEGVDLEGVHLIVVSSCTCVFVVVPLRSARVSTLDRLRPRCLVTAFLLFLLVPAFGNVGFAGWEYWVLLVFGILLSMPFAWIIVRVAARSWFAVCASVIHVGFGFAAVFMLAPLGSEVIGAEVLVLLPIGVVVPLFFFTILMLGAHRFALRCRGCPVSGALTQSILMVLLVLPVAAAAILSVEQSGIPDFWKTFCSVCVGLFFGNVVGVPLSRFLREVSGLYADGRRGSCRGTASSGENWLFVTRANKTTGT